MKGLFRHGSGDRPLLADPQPADIGSRAMQGSIAAVASQATRLGLQLIGSMVLARLLAPGDFGLVAMGTVVVGFANQLADFGLASATVQRKELDESTVSALFYVQMGLALFLTVAIMAASPLVAKAFDDTRVQLLVIVLAPTVLFLASSSQHVAMLNRQMRWSKMLGIGIVAQGVGSTVGIVVAVTTDVGYWALVVQSWSATLTQCTLAWFWSPWMPGRVTDWSRTRESIRFGVGLTAYNLLNSWHRQFDNMVIGALAGPAQLGFYSRAYGLLMIPMNAVVRPFNTAVYPAMSRLQSDAALWRRMFLSSVATVTCLTAPLGALLVLLADALVPLLFGEQWQTSIPIFKILAITIPIQAIYNAAGLISFSHGKTRRMLKAAVLSTGIYTIAFLLGAQGGAIGVAIAYTIAVYLIVPVWVWWAARGTSLNLLRISRAVAPPLGAALAAFGVVSAVPCSERGPIEEILTGGAFCLIYATFLALPWLAFEGFRKDVQPVVHRTLTVIGGLRIRVANS